jgi:hypothetical protein
MKQGTISILIGTHSIHHSINVIRAWKRVHGNYPKPWQIVCIFLHDIGHIGLDYLDNIEEKKIHWKLGARAAGCLFGKKGFDLVAGHCPKESGVDKSKLWLPDKVSRAITPLIIHVWDKIIEPKLRHPNMTLWEDSKFFRQKVKENLNKKEPKSTHEIFLKDWYQEKS